MAQISRLSPLQAAEHGRGGLGEILRRVLAGSTQSDGSHLLAIPYRCELKWAVAGLQLNFKSA